MDKTKVTKKKAIQGKVMMSSCEWSDGYVAWWGLEEDQFNEWLQDLVGKEVRITVEVREAEV